MAIINYENNFDTLVEHKAVVDFYATWCGPCKMFGPLFEEMSNKYDFNFIKVNVDEYPEIARQYGVMSIPTVILFENGKEVKKNIGFMSQDDFEKFLK